MKAFADLFEALDRTTRTSEKVTLLEEYFRRVPPTDAAWALHFLSGNRLKRAVRTSFLRQCAAEVADIPLWIVDDCQEAVGDLGETLALLLPEPTSVSSLRLSELVEQRLLPLAKATEARQREILRQTWTELGAVERLLWNKLLTGNFRVGVSRTLIVRALASIAGIEPAVMEHRIMGEWKPSADGFHQLLAAERPGIEPARPYPFYLASPLDQEAASLGDVLDWQFEWKWDGIRAQLIRRSSQILLWSRGEEIITPGFPEIAQAALGLDDGTVLDGEILAWAGDRPAPFHQLQRRLNRRTLSAALLRDVPVVFMTYDILESNGVDLRSRPLKERRALLEQVLHKANLPREESPTEGSALMIQEELFPKSPSTEPPPRAQPPRLLVSTELALDSWEALAMWQAQARASGTEGLMLKRRSSPYGVGRQRGAWWKWKVSPLTCDAVLIAAQYGHGRRATLYTDYTFGVWDGRVLVPIAKAYSGLTDEEIDAVDAFVRGHTTGRFGPVRAVTPELVFELAFEGIAASSRHASGIALRFPRMNRWRHDKKAAEADTLETLRQCQRGLESASESV